MSDEPEARVIQGPDGQLILDDPAARGVIAAVEAHNRSIDRQNLRSFIVQNRERIDYFVQRILDRGLTWQDAVVTCIQVDDPLGGQLADALMPGHDWQAIRDLGQVPCARGLAGREGIQEMLDALSKLAPGYENIGRQLSDIRTYALVAVGYGTVVVEPLDPPNPQNLWDRLGRPDGLVDGG